MRAFIERLSDVCGRVSAWMFVAIGAMIAYEVLVRYVFVAPTIWADEMSRFFQIWATYLAAAYVLRHRELIVIEFFRERLPARWRRLADLFALIVILVFCAVAVGYGIAIVHESVVQGRHTSTMLSVPKWMTESAVPLGFGLLGLEALVEIGRTLAQPAQRSGDRAGARSVSPEDA